jgi:hypothetical protein
MFLSLLPAWVACCLFYGTSQRQTLLKKPLSVIPFRITAILLLWVMLLKLFVHLPTVSALITGLSLVCCFLPLVTLISAYKNQYLWLTTVFVFILSVSFSVIRGDL